jgi:hypothetical protein
MVTPLPVTHPRPGFDSTMHPSSDALGEGSTKAYFKLNTKAR